MHKNNFINTLIAILSFLLVIFVIAFIFKFTNGFNEDLKTFYVEHNDELIVSTNTQMSFDSDVEYRFDCNYISNPDNNSFNLKVLPNVSVETDFKYKVDGKTYSWSEVKDLTSCFQIDKHDKYFILTLPSNFTMLTVLNSLYPNSDVVISDTLFISEYYFTLQISSYNEKIVYNINFNFSDSDCLKNRYNISFVSDGSVLKTENVIEYNTIIPPETPIKNGYNFVGWLNSRGSIVDFTTYTACENMTFTAKFSLNTVNVSFSFKNVSSSSGGDTGSGDTGSGGTGSFSMPYWGTGENTDNEYGSVSPDFVSLSIENESVPVTYSLKSGYTYSHYEVDFSSNGSDVSPYSLTSYPFDVVISGSTITLTLLSIPDATLSYIITIFVSGTSSGGGSVTV